ncbi:hypothetical protein Pint_19205 [Pistacia integerrima]|uniref:Uncharacterized protein n=1 Tax=Pistacia integerrima TaxID=434235 RepID=A0ACC0YZG1_9ROSI|nr:hypothetical protein Pint_19205 [Pistacia integerrima]
MAEPKDQGIKLFGRTIPLPEVSSAAAPTGWCSADESVDQDPACSGNSSLEEEKNRDCADGEEMECEKDISGEKPTETKQEDGSPPMNSDESSNPGATAEMKELRIQLTYRGGENGDAHSNGSSVTVSNSKDEAAKIAPQEAAMPNGGFPPQMPCYPGAPWPYPWTSAQWTSPLPPPAFCPPGFPMPFYPAAAYWG